MTVSLIGDGIFLIAIAWESYVLWNAPAALSIVGIGMTIPTIVFLLLGGVVSDRHDRRLVMAWADGLRAAAVAVLAVLVLIGCIALLGARCTRRGLRRRYRILHACLRGDRPRPAPGRELPAANALDQFVRPIALRLVGPVLGGALVAVSTGLAFAVDALSFAATLVAVLAIRPQPRASVAHPSTARR